MEKFGKSYEIIGKTAQNRVTSTGRIAKTNRATCRKRYSSTKIQPLLSEDVVTSFSAKKAF